MTLYEWIVIAATGIILALAVWVPLRRWSAHRGGPFPDVPDAPSSSEPLDAPGMTLPYSSLDPFAPPKPANRTRADGAIEPDDGS